MSIWFLDSEMSTYLIENNYDDTQTIVIMHIHMI